MKKSVISLLLFLGLVAPFSFPGVVSATGACTDSLVGLPVYGSQQNSSNSLQLDILGTTSPQAGIFCLIRGATTTGGAVGQNLVANFGNFTFNPVSANIKATDSGANLYGGNYMIILSTSGTASTGSNTGVVYYRIDLFGNVFGDTTTGTVGSDVFAGQTATATLQMMQGSCAQAGNIFSEGICTAFAFLFAPSPESLEGFSSLASSTQAKFPVIAQVASVLSGLTASSTDNLPTYTLNLHDLGIGSTTAIGNILPNFDALSSSTVTRWAPAGAIPALKGLAAAAIWLAFALDVFYTTRTLFKTA